MLALDLKKYQIFRCYIIKITGFFNNHIFSKVLPRPIKCIACGSPAISLQYTVSLVYWINRLLSRPENQQFASPRCTNWQWNRFLLLALSHYIGDPDVNPDKTSFLVVFAVTLTTLLVPVPFSLHVSDYGDILLRSHQAHTRYSLMGPVD
jgi:hypothetical protein